MLEILSHQFLKKFVRSHCIDWDHIYSFGRIISKCIQNDSTYLINSEIFYTQEWIVAVFISLFLHQEDSTFVLNSEKIRFFSHRATTIFEDFERSPGLPGTVPEHFGAQRAKANP